MTELGILEALASSDLHWADYVVFVGFLILIVVVGVVIGVVNRKKATAKEFLTAGSDMHFFPVALSLQAAFVSAIFVVSLPAESYNFGIGYAYFLISYLPSFLLIGFFILPTFFRLEITSAYEYLEMRFNRAVRLSAAMIFLAEMLLYISVVIYTPAIAIQQVTPLPTYACILLVSGVCIIYTVIGGMRATIWNDLIQMFVIMICVAMLIGFGHSKTGSMSEIYEIARNGSRLNFNVFNPDPTVRITFWTQTVGGVFLNFAMYGASQAVIQKALSTRSLAEAKKSLVVLGFTYAITLALVMWLGVLMYAYFVNCDPQLEGSVDKPDQMVPKFLMEVMGDMHGLPGLFLAAVFSGALSSVSGGLNSMAGVVLVDIIQPIYKKHQGKPLADRASNIVSRILVFVIGAIVTGLAFATPLIGDLIVTIALSIFGMMGGPLTGVVMCGIFMPCCNSWGALTGLLVSLGLTVWIGIGTMIDGPPLPFLPRSTEGCITDNITAFTTTHSYVTQGFQPTEIIPEVEYLGIYHLSYMYYGMFAIGTCIIVAFLVSAMTGFDKNTPHIFIYPCADTCCKCYPDKTRECCRCWSLPPDDEDNDEVAVHFKKSSEDKIIDNKHPVRHLSFKSQNLNEYSGHYNPSPEAKKDLNSMYKPPAYEQTINFTVPKDKEDTAMDKQHHNGYMHHTESGIITNDGSESDPDSAIADVRTNGNTLERYSNEAFDVTSF